VSQYQLSHQNSINRWTHTVGIPMIAVSVPLLMAGYWYSAALNVGLGLFIVGWVLQFIGHIFEGKKPEFFKDWRFLFVGLRWWLAKMKGQV